MPNYNVMLGELQEEFKRATTERELLDRRIAGLMKAMEAVKVLAEDSPDPIVPPPLDDEAGFTDKVRNLLRANPARSFTAVEIRDVFLEFYPKADAKIMLIHTHNTLKRLLKQQELEEVSGDGRTAYRVKGDSSFGGVLAALAMQDIKPGSAVIEILKALGAQDDAPTPGELKPRIASRDTARLVDKIREAREREKK